MWQKANPTWYRVGVTKKWPSEWFVISQAQKASYFVEDIKIRKLIEDFYFRTWISKVVIRKSEADGEILIFTAKPASVIWKDWKKLEDFQKQLQKISSKEFKVNVKEVRVPELSAKIMWEFAAMQLENRMPYRRVAKSVLQKVMEKWAVGVKIQVWWRLGGVDLSRSEAFTDGRIPLQTLRADIDYHYTTALTKYGILGVKVWICKGENVNISRKKAALDKIQN